MQVLPLSFHHRRGQTYHNYPDNREMDPKDFYRALRAGEMATTAAVNMADYTEAIEPLLQAGRDVLVLAFSSGLSATYHSSKHRRWRSCVSSIPERKAVRCGHPVRLPGPGPAGVVRRPGAEEGQAPSRRCGTGPEENKLHLCHWFTVDDLHFLKRGGRISAATAVLGSMLQIKPVHPRGRRGPPHQHGQGQGPAVPPSRPWWTRWQETAIDPAGPDRLHQPRRLPGGRRQAVAEDGPKSASACRTCRINYVGPVIGAHSGPGTLALFLSGHSALSRLLFSSQRSVSMDEIKWLEVAVNTTPDRAGRG